MINWTKGLTEEQEQLLQKLLDEESLIPVKKYLLKSKSRDIEVVGKLLPRNKLVQDREYGYTIYIEEDNVLRKFSAFNYTITEIEEIR